MCFPNSIWCSFSWLSKLFDVWQNNLLSVMWQLCQSIFVGQIKCAICKLYMFGYLKHSRRKCRLVLDSFYTKLYDIFIFEKIIIIWVLIKRSTRLIFIDLIFHLIVSLVFSSPIYLRFLYAIARKLCATVKQSIHIIFLNPKTSAFLFHPLYNGLEICFILQLFYLCFHINIHISCYFEYHQLVVAYKSKPRTKKREADEPQYKYLLTT